MRVNYINEKGEVTKQYPSYPLDFKTLYSQTPAIFQPGSFFKKTFTDKIGVLKPYQCCFDYEYILRILKNNGKVVKVNAYVAGFRYYAGSKSGSQTPVFLEEQFSISKLYGRKTFSFLTFMLSLRIIKRRIFN